MLRPVKAICFVAATCLAAPVLAEDIVLTISGAVAPSDDGETWRLSMSDLKALPVARFDTVTIWTDGTQTFEGVSLRALLDHVGASDGDLEAVALNDYAVTIPASDAVEGGPIVAYAHNGQAMSVRDKGPLWVVYPFDANDTYKSEEYYARSIWQLDRIVVADGN